MSYWPFWVSGVALTSIGLLHWLTLGRTLAVSGRFTALVDRWRHGSAVPETQMSTEDMMAAIRAASLIEFGPEDITMEAPVADLLSGAQGISSAAIRPAAPPPAAPPTMLDHALFLGGLALGGALATALSGSFAPTLALHGELFGSLTQGNPGFASGLLLLGGVFVGFGTRMSGGCTSGHGLCGVSRFQPGSVVATMAFFGAGIAVSFALGAFL